MSLRREVGESRGQQGNGAELEKPFCFFKVLLKIYNETKILKLGNSSSDLGHRSVSASVGTAV